MHGFINYLYGKTPLMFGLPRWTIILAMTLVSFKASLLDGIVVTPATIAILYFSYKSSLNKK